MRKLLHIIVPVLCAILVFCGSFAGSVVLAGQFRDQDADSFVVGIAWTDDPSQYAIQCIYTVSEELGESYQKLDMVRSYDLNYDEQDQQNEPALAA